MKIKKQVNVNGDNALNDDIFVVEYKNEYRLLLTSLEKAIKVFDNKDTAIEFAKALQNKKRTNLFVMDYYGKLVECYPFINSSETKTIISSENDTSDKKIETIPKVTTAIPY